VELSLETAGPDELSNVTRQVRLVETRTVRLDQPIPYLVAHAMRGRTHQMRDRRGARPRRVGERHAGGVATNLRGVRIDEPLPVRLLAVVAARRAETAGPVAAVWEVGS